MKKKIKKKLIKKEGEGKQAKDKEELEELGLNIVFDNYLTMGEVERNVERKVTRKSTRKKTRK